MNDISRLATKAQMSRQEKQAFDQWLSATAVLSSMLAIGLVTFAIMGAADFGGSHSAKAKADTFVAGDTLPSTSIVPSADLLIVPVLDRR